MCLNFGGSNKNSTKVMSTKFSHHMKLWVKMYVLSTQLFQTQKLESHLCAVAAPVVKDFGAGEIGGNLEVSLAFDSRKKYTLPSFM